MVLALQAKDYGSKFACMAQTSAGLVAQPISRAFVHGCWLQTSMKGRIRA